MKGRGVLVVHLFSLTTVFVIDLQNYVMRSHLFTRDKPVEISGIQFLNSYSIIISINKIGLVEFNIRFEWGRPAITRFLIVAPP